MAGIRPVCVDKYTFIRRIFIRDDRRLSIITDRRQIMVYITASVRGILLFFFFRLPLI